MIVMAVFIALLTLFAYLIFKPQANKVPGPLELPFIGNLWVLGVRSLAYPHLALLDLAKKWGPIYKLKLGSRDVIVLTDPTLIRTLFSGQSHPAIPKFLTKTVLLNCYEQGVLLDDFRHTWAAMRKISSPVVHNVPKGKTILQIINGEIDLLTASFDELVSQKKDVHLFVKFGCFTRNVVLRQLYGKTWQPTTLEADEETTNLSEAMKKHMSSANLLCTFMPSFDAFAYESRPLRETCLRTMNAFCLNRIKEHEEEPVDPRDSCDVLDLLLFEHRTNKELFTSEALLSVLNDVLFAGSTTVSDTLDWMFLYLCTYPDIQEQCYKEIREKLQGRRPVMGDLNELVHLDGVIKETFRLRPPAPLSIPHLTDRDTQVEGWSIPRNTIIISNVYGVGNWDRFYKHSNEFDPSRWRKDPSLAENLLHFGCGPTICLGMALAKQELFLAAATLIQRYKFSLSPSSPSPDFRGKFAVTFNPSEWLANVQSREDQK